MDRKDGILGKWLMKKLCRRQPENTLDGPYIRD